MLLAVCLLPGCELPEAEVTVQVAEAATLDLPPVPNAPARLQVVSYGPEPDARPELGSCAIRVRDPVNLVDWHIDASQAWERKVRKGDTTFVRHVVIGDYIPARRDVYGMTERQIIKVDCAAYGVLGLAIQGG